MSKLVPILRHSENEEFSHMPIRNQLHWFSWIYFPIQEAYEYDNAAVVAGEKGGGQRLVGASAASHENLPFLVGWRSQAVDGPDEPECTGEDGPSLYKGDRSGQVISSLGRQVRTDYLFFRETGQDKPSLLQGDRSGQAISSLERQIRTGPLFIWGTGQDMSHPHKARKDNLFIRETRQDRLNLH